MMGLRIVTAIATGALLGGTAAAARAPHAPARPPLVQEKLAAGSYAAQAVQGAEIASDWCVSCHIVRPDRGTDIAPTFAQIAAQRTPEQIRAFLARPHGPMPPIQLSNSEIDDILAYLKSLNPGR